MNKPDWKDAPEWAQYLAMDADGAWYWYELRPIALRDSWAPNGRSQLAAIQPWLSSLESRP